MRNKLFAPAVFGLGLVGLTALAPGASAYPPTTGYHSYSGSGPHWHWYATPYGYRSYYVPHWHYDNYRPYSRYYGGYYGGYGRPYDYGRPYYYGRPYSYSYGRPYYYRW
jgi:hypothetical protein